MSNFFGYIIIHIGGLQCLVHVVTPILEQTVDHTKTVKFLSVQAVALPIEGQWGVHV